MHNAKLWYPFGINFENEILYDALMSFHNQIRMYFCKICNDIILHFAFCILHYYNLNFFWRCHFRGT